MESQTSYNRSGAIALVLGFLAGLVTMLTHPTGRAVIEEATRGGSNLGDTLAHTLGIVGQILLVCGTLALTQRLRVRRDIAIAGFVSFAFASVAIMLAATASGFMSPMTVRGIGEADEARRAAMMAAMSYTFLFNQAFAKLSVILSCAAIALWSVAMLIGREFSQALAWFGILLGAALAGVVAFGVLPLGIHGFMIVVIVQGAWFSSVAMQLWRDPA